jgi:hypothetical protein
VPSGETQAIEPPPVPTVITSTIGTFTAKRPTDPSVVRLGRPSLITATSVDVPPPSRVITRSKPACPATSAAPSVPAAGPERIVVIGLRRTSGPAITPPLDFMM